MSRSVVKCSVEYIKLLHSTEQYNTIQYSTVKYNNVQCSTGQ